MGVQKTVRRHGRTLAHGRFAVGETVYVCRGGCKHEGKPVIVRSRQLAQLLLPHSTVGYDVLAFVGRQRFVLYRQRDEIRALLEKQYGIILSAGEVSGLARRFVVYLERLHWQSAPVLRAAIEADGGWPMHVDATGEDGRGTVVTILAGWRGWVLHAWKAPTERAEFILPEMHRVAEAFGAPCAIMRDLGRAMTEAADQFVQSLDKAIPVLACHQHFVSDIGKDLLTVSHDQLRNLFRQVKLLPHLRLFIRQLGKCLGESIGEGREAMNRWLEARDPTHPIPEGAGGITAVRSLAQWILDFRSDGSGRGFPYDLPWLNLYVRCLTIAPALATFLETPPNDAPVRKAMQKLQRILNPVAQDPQTFVPVGQAITKRADLFDRLRSALRLDDGEKETAKKLNDVQAAIKRLTRALQKERPERGPAQDKRKAIDVILKHLDRHGPYLSGHVITMPGTKGEHRLVARTNNILEGLFHTVKHGERRRSGRKVLTQDFEALPAAAVLATNLRHPDYVILLCGSLQDLSQAFAKLDAGDRSRSIAANTSLDLPKIESASLSTADKKIIRQPIFESRVLGAAQVQ